VPQETPYIVILNKQKYHFFFFLFSYTKSEKRKMEQVLPGGVGTDGRGKEVRKW
jgi:hypothetical protein